MEELTKRSARAVLDDHLNIANRLGPDDNLERIVQDDLDRNVAEDCVILMNRGMPPDTARCRLVQDDGNDDQDDGRPGPVARSTRYDKQDARPG